MLVVPINTQRKKMQDPQVPQDPQEMKTPEVRMEPISYKSGKDFVLPRHYAGRYPSVSYTFGLFENDKLKAVILYGKPPSGHLCDAIVGKEYKDDVFELQRMIREENTVTLMSTFVGWTLRQLKKENRILVSYSDVGQGHNGYVYQATNWLYTGKSKETLETYVKGNKHARHAKKDKDYQKNKHLKQVNTEKNRYIFFAGDKRYVKKMKKLLKWEVLPYPKGDNTNYTLGEYQGKMILNTETGERYREETINKKDLTENVDEW